MTVWCNVDLGDAATARLRELTADHELVFGKEPPPGGAEIAFGQPSPETVLSFPQLRWVQITSAGYTPYDTPSFWDRLSSKGAMFTNSSSVYDEPCAQHLVAMMLAFARQLPAAWHDQNRQDWRTPEIRQDSYLLCGQKLLLVGFGAIARRVVELVRPFNLEIVALRRKPTGTEPVPTYSIDQFSKWLGWADDIANILPANAHTTGLFNSDRFSELKAGARFYNIGRGTTVDQTALIQALESGRLSAAYLDVTDPEPLPPNHPLWSAPNCWITPHSAGGHAGEELRLVEHFGQNLTRFASNQPLINHVNA